MTFWDFIIYCVGAVIMTANIFMKKLNFITALTITAGLAFAWNATAVDNIYGVYEDHDTGAWFADFAGGGNDSVGYLEKSTFTALYNDSVLSLTIERNKTENGFSFGTYTYDPQTGKITGTTLLGSVAGNQSTTINAANGVIAEGSTAFSEGFKANEVVGLWVQETGSDLVYLSDNSQTLKYGANSKTVADYVRYGEDPNKISNYFSSLEEANAANDPNVPNPTTFTRMQYTEGYVDGTANDKDYGRATVWFDDAVDVRNYDIGYGYPGQETEAAIKIHIEGVAPGLASKPTEKGPSLGGPLPGVWATIALAGAASAYLRRRKNK